MQNFDPVGMGGVYRNIVNLSQAQSLFIVDRSWVLFKFVYNFILHRQPTILVVSCVVSLL